MKYKYSFILLLLFGIGFQIDLLAQTEETECNPLEGLPVASGEVIFNYGSVSNSFNTSRKSDIIYGQPLVGAIQNQNNTSEFGFWSVLRMPPQAPSLLSTQGDFPDRVQLQWKENPLGPVSSEGFIVTRDGAFLARIDPGIYQFIDFNVQAGEFYEYGVKGVNAFGNGIDDFSIGFVNPNGVVTGQVLTRNGNPVPGAVVTMEPTIGQSMQFDGESDYLCVSHHQNVPTDMFTVSAWMKIDAGYDSDGIIDLGSDLNENFWLHTTPSTMDKGVVFGVGDGTNDYTITYEFEDIATTQGEDERDNWHHVAALYGGQSMILYVDGEFVASKSIGQAISNSAALFSIGSRRDQSGFFKGWIDDVRFYDRLLTQTDIIVSKDIAVSKDTEGLAAYWKFDEGLGEKAFDLSNNEMHGVLVGASFSDDTPEIKNGAITDVTGYYSIEGINYSKEQSFTVTPEKIFYDNYSLEFNAVKEASATLTNFDLADTGHIEIVVYPFDLENTAKQSLLSKMEGSTEAFNLYLEAGKFYLSINDDAKLLGDAKAGYQHIALSLNSLTGAVTYYLDGEEETTHTYASFADSWLDEAWQLGAKGVNTPTQYYTGLIDEVAFYKGAFLTVAEIQSNAASFGAGGTSIGHPNLSTYFNLNESTGTELMDVAADMTGFGEVKNATFSIIGFRQGETAHEFEPNRRRVNINNSATAIPNIDFTDISTVSVSGVVRFENTFCYQDSVEILVNGERNFPPIFTNEDGAFVGDFEPGANLTFTPVYGSDSTAHEFFPAFFEVRRLNVPIANVLFQNTTKREIEGQLYGGLCRKSIIPVNDDGEVDQVVEIELATQNGCLTRTLRLTNPNGKYKFKNIPPIPVTVTLAEYSVSSIVKQEIQDAGAPTIDLRHIEKDTVDFAYFAKPQVEVGEVNSIVGYNCDPNADPDDASVPFIKDSQEFKNAKIYENEIRVFEDYSLGANSNPKCYLDSFDLRIINGIQESSLQELKSDTSFYTYQYYANNPNLIAPHIKTLSVVAKVDTKTSDPVLYRTIVLGERQNESTISTAGPIEVLGVVYDPPGDNSSATLTSGTKFCTTWESATLKSREGGLAGSLALGTKMEILVGGIGGGVINEVGFENTTTLTGSFSTSTTNTTGAEFCFETVKEISTSDGDDIWGSYADVFFGAAMNFKVGTRDVLDYDFDSCTYTDGQVLSFEPEGFSTDFVLSEWQILTEIIPQLQDIIDAGVGEGVTQEDVDLAKSSRDKWLFEVSKKRQAQRAANYDDRNITFDAASVYTETYTSELSESSSFTTSIGGAAQIENETGFMVSGNGASVNVNIGFNRSNEDSNGETESETITTSFTLADDDLNDFYSVSIAQELPEFTEDTQDELIDQITDVLKAIPTAETQVIGTVGDILFDLPGEQKRFNISDSPFATTPMFRLEGGESMCPWIPGTRNREEVFVRVENPIETNISTNQAAVFQVELGNIGPNGVDGLVYQVGVEADGNPDGALISMDGTELVGIGGVVPFQFVGTESITKQIAVETNTSESSSFDSLKLYFGSVCQIEHSQSVGYDPADPNGGFLIYQEYADNNAPGEDYYNRFYKGFQLSAQFVEPCVPINVSFPGQNHVVTPGNEILNIIANEYDNTDPDLREIRVQYRPIPGNGAWINVLTVEEDQLADNPSPLMAPFDMTELKDGMYEIRSITDCKGQIGGDLSPGISEIIRIKKETEAPELFGTPEPADGILTAGDAISITFNELINCDKIFAADGIGTNINLNNVALINTETGGLVPFSHQCVNDKIIITPEVESRFINGKILKARVTDVEDLAENKMEVPIGAPGSPTVNYKEWEFLVDLNPLRWQAGSNINEAIEEGNLVTITRNITNESGTARNFTITGPRQDNTDGSVTYADIPDWVTITPYFGTLEAGEVRTVEFTFPADLVADEYLSEINVVGSEGNNAIDANVRVTCAGPIWEFDPAQYNFTMSLTLQLDIEGEISTDIMDEVAAFVGPELRGTAHVQHEPSIDPDGDGIGTYFAFLTIYSNEFQGEEIELKIWDVSDCLIYGEVLEDFTFVADNFIGSPLEPTVVHTVNIVARTIQIHEGWNWFSYNVGLPNNSTADVLSTLTQPEDATIVGRRPTPGFSTYSETEGGFTGTLPNLTHESMYQYRSYSRDSIQLSGVPINVADVQIPIVEGWNWIGFIPQQALPLKEALSSLTPLNGDIVKSQTAFAQFVAGIDDWIGNLNFMSPLVGYQLNISNEGTLQYPESLKGEEEVKFRDEQQFTDYWTPQPELYEYTMNMIGIVVDGSNVVEEGDEVGVFFGEELRGVGKTVYVEHNDTYLIFLTAYANTFNEELTFRFYDRSTDQVYDLDETVFFSPNQITGSVEEPTEWTLGETVNTEDLYYTNFFNVFPNPASERVYLNFKMPASERVVVSVKDALGKEIERLELNAQAGMNNLEWTPTGLANGIYMISLEKEETVLTQRIMIQK